MYISKCFRLHATSCTGVAFKVPKTKQGTPCLRHLF